MKKYLFVKSLFLIFLITPHFLQSKLIRPLRDQCIQQLDSIYWEGLLSLKNYFKEYNFYFVQAVKSVLAR